jgi:transcriptional regulator with XRE-family HTH domain
VPAELADDERLLHERRRIGRSIRDAREARNLTQEQVFLAVPVNRAYYQQIESGEANPSLNMLLRLSWAIGAPVDEFFGQARSDT